MILSCKNCDKKACTYGETAGNNEFEVFNDKYGSSLSDSVENNFPQINHFSLINLKKFN